MWKNYEDDDDYTLFETSVGEEIRFIMHVSLCVLVGVAIILSVALK